MKKTILLSILLFIGTTAIQAQGWEWKYNAGIIPVKIIKDLDNDLYIIHKNPPGFAIEKRDTEGASLWSIGGAGDATISSYRIDNSNNLVVVGNFYSNLYIAGDTLVPNGTESFFILKFSPSGIMLSAKGYGSATRTFATCLFINAAGNYLIGGGFTGTFDVNGVAVSGDSVLNAFIIKTDENENLIYAEKSSIYTPSGEAFINELEETPSGNMYATITMTNGLATINGFNFWPTYGKYICVFDDSRNVLWMNHIESSSSSTRFSDLQTLGEFAFMKEYPSIMGYDTSRLHRWTYSGNRATKTFPGTITLGYHATNGKVYYGLYTDSAAAPQNRIGTLSLNLDDAGESVHTTSVSPEYISQIQCINDNSFYAGIWDSGAKYGKYTTAGPTASIGSIAEMGRNLVYPNPTNGIFTIDIGQIPIEGNDQVCVFDTYGHCLKQQTFGNSKSQQLDISDLAKGIYFLELTIGNERINKKIILN